MMKSRILNFALRLVPAVIMLQSLFFKFSASTESVYIFSKLGIEPAGRIGSGVAELIASVLLLIPRTAKWGALLGTGILTGAIVSHLTLLGIEVMEDRGQLFIYALITWVCCVVLLYQNRHNFFNTSNN